MKRRLILVNLGILFASLFLILIVSSVAFLNIYSDNSEQELNSYLNMACSVYEDNNPDEVLEVASATNPELRVSIIGLDGKVIADSSVSNVGENHLNRDEIQNPGKIYQRYSETVNRKMIYVAKQLDDCYIRVAIPVSSVNGFISKYISISTVLVIITFAISTIVLVKMNDKSLEPVNKQINQLASSVGDTEYGKLSVDDLPIVLSLVSKKINDRINDAEYNKDRLLSLIEEVDQGIIVIDERGYINLVNQKVYILLDFQGEDVVAQKYLYLIDNINLQEKIDDSLKNKNNNSIVIESSGRFISVQIKHVATNWLRDGVILTLLDVTKEKLLEENKKEFFQNASHELKSPLTCIIGYQQMVTEGIISGDKEIIETSRKTLEEALRMNEILSDMLNLSAFELGKKTQKDNINLKDIASDLISSLHVKAIPLNISIESELEDVLISANRLEMTELFRNLIDNAIKYNKQNGTINVVLNDKFFMVKDTGIGIDTRDLDRIFERFYRVDKARSRKTGGTGLGLAIVKHICINNGFKIELESKLGEGSTFTIRF